jgi:hypothetical protein
MLAAAIASDKAELLKERRGRIPRTSLRSTSRSPAELDRQEPDYLSRRPLTIMLDTAHTGQIVDSATGERSPDRAGLAVGTVSLRRVD